MANTYYLDTVLGCNQWRIQDYPEERCQPITLATFPQKLHENEKKLDPEDGARVRGTPPQPWIRQW